MVKAGVGSSRTGSKDQPLWPQHFAGRLITNNRQAQQSPCRVTLDFGWWHEFMSKSEVGHTILLGSLLLKRQVLCCTLHTTFAAPDVEIS